MAKTAKKPVANHGKPITSFFARSTKQPPTSQNAPSTSAGTASSARSSSATHEVSENTPNSSVTAVAFAEIPRTPVKSSVPLSVSSSQKVERSNATQAPLTPSNTSSLKRSRGPDAQSPVKPTTPSSRTSDSLKTTPERRRTKFDSDSDIEMSGMTSVYVSSMSNPPRHKKARLSPSDDEPLAVIPSSQSDEEELTFNGATPDIPKKPITKSHERPIPLTPETDNQNEMVPLASEHNSEVANQPETSLSTELTPGDKNLGRSMQPTEQMLTPPSSDLSSMPPTPKLVDPDQKIAKLRAEVFAETSSSPEHVPVEFNEQLDSSSDEDIVVAPLAKLKKKTTPNSEASSIEPAKRTTRYSLRNRSPHSPSNGSRSKASTSQLGEAKTRSSDPLSRRNYSAKFEKFNPFQALLKEKRAAERRGAGDEAFRLAEMTALNLKNKGPLDDMELDEDGEIDWEAATRSARDMQTLVDEPPKSDVDPRGKSLKALDEEDRKILLGATKGNGKGLVDILEQDQASKREADTSDQRPGIQLWSSLIDESDEAGNTMVVDDNLSTRQLPGNSLVIRLINACLRRNDISQTTMLLDTDFMLPISLSERSPVASSICELALSSQSDLFGESATRALEAFWSSKNEPLDSTISFAQVLNTIHHLGVNPAVLTSQMWSVPGSGRLRCVDPIRRSTTIGRLVLLFESCARSQRLVKSDIPNMVIALLLIGMDLEASPDIVEDVTRAVDLACNCISTADTGLGHDLCSKILRCIGSYEPMNKARMLSLLSAGAGVTRKVANVVAHCVITDRPCPRKNLTFDLPPLAEIIDQLVPDSDTPGKFSLNEQTNYDDIGFYTFILGIAVSNIREYVIEERSPKSKASRAEGLSKGGEKQQTDLQVVRSALETLHNKISDTRAAHLERSRAKAAIKALSMGIHYQREHCLRNDPELRSKTLSQYFQKKDKP